jgi:hypothetical protein
MLQQDLLVRSVKLVLMLRGSIVSGQQ